MSAYHESFRNKRSQNFDPLAQHILGKNDKSQILNIILVNIHCTNVQFINNDCT